MEFDADETCAGFQEENPDAITELFASEVQQLPPENFLEMLKADDFVAAFHQQAMSLIWQTEQYNNIDPFVLYVAAEYVNRFISRKKLKENMPWVLDLLVVSTLSLALKSKSKTFSLGDLQRDGVPYFDSQAVHRMELLILDSLDWRLRIITPFSFVHFFLNLIKFQNLSSLEDAVKNRTFDIIFKAQPDPSMFQFQPSIIAGSAVLWATHELSPLQFPSSMTKISSCQHIDEKKLVKCLNKMQRTLRVEGGELTWNAELCASTPASVLENH